MLRVRIDVGPSRMSDFVGNDMLPVHRVAMPHIPQSLQEDARGIVIGFDGHAEVIVYVVTAR